MQITILLYKFCTVIDQQFRYSKYSTGQPWQEMRLITDFEKVQFFLTRLYQRIRRAGLKARTRDQYLSYRDSNPTHTHRPRLYII